MQNGLALLTNDQTWLKSVEREVVWIINRGIFRAINDARLNLIHESDYVQ